MGFIEEKNIPAIFTMAGEPIDAQIERARKSLALPNPEKAMEGIAQGVIAFCSAMKALAESDFTELSAPELSKTVMNLAKAISEKYRLVEFSQGRADSRTDISGLSELLDKLTDEQFQTFQVWVGLKKDEHSI